MTELATATRTILLRRRSSAAYLELDPALQLGAGGEARVYEVPGLPGTVAKLYREPTPERARKLELMLANPPALPDAGTALAWPTDLLLDAGGIFSGFLMPRAEGPRVFELYNPTTRRRRAPLFHWGLLHRAGANLAAVFAALHARGYVVGDVNESNILLAPDGAVTLVDADSFQVRDPASELVFRSHVGKVEFTPPELQGRSFAGFDRTPEHDRFGLAVLVFLLLMEGNHPFAVQMAGGEEVPPVEERIRWRTYPHAPPREGRLLPPRLAPSIETLHPALEELFLRAFVEGHLDPSRRPSAGAWREALAVAEAELDTCGANPQHRFAKRLDGCPWCERRRLLGGRDPFPATVDAARATDLAPLPRPRAVAMPPRMPMAPQPARPAPALAAHGGHRMGRYASGAPASLQHPAVWLAPTAVMATLAVSPALQAMAAVGLVLALLAMFRSQRPAFSGGMALAMAVLSILAMMLSRIGSAPTYMDDYDPPPPAESTPPPLLAPAADPPPVEEPATGVYDQAVDEQPELLNRAEVARALTRNYPPALRDAGVSGTVLLRFRIGADGFPDASSHQVVTATDDGFIPAAVGVVSELRFRPARIGGQPVSAWVTVPITFTMDT